MSTSIIDVLRTMSAINQKMIINDEGTNCRVCFLKDCVCPPPPLRRQNATIINVNETMIKEVMNTCALAGRVVTREKVIEAYQITGGSLTDTCRTLMPDIEMSGIKIFPYIDNNSLYGYIGDSTSPNLCMCMHPAFNDANRDCQCRCHLYDEVKRHHEVAVEAHGFMPVLGTSVSPEVSPMTQPSSPIDQPLMDYDEKTVIIPIQPLKRPDSPMPIIHLNNHNRVYALKPFYMDE